MIGGSSHVTSKLVKKENMGDGKDERQPLLQHDNTAGYPSNEPNFRGGKMTVISNVSFFSNPCNLVIFYIRNDHSPFYVTKPKLKIVRINF